MLPNNNPGFYIICKDGHGKVRIVRFYETLEKLVFAEKYHNFYGGKKASFSEDLNERVPYHWDKYFYLRDGDLFDDQQGSQSAFVVVDHFENVVPLCELNRVSTECFQPYRYRRYNWRRTAYGSWRRVNTFQEKKAYYDTLEQEVPIKVRGCRKSRQLPDAWDDLHSHNDKCWKTQSKRRHQWKDK